MVKRAAAIPLLALCIVSAPAQAQGGDTLRNDITTEVLLALKYGRCEDALNLLIEEERAWDTLSREHLQLMAGAYTCLGSYSAALAIYDELLAADAANPACLLRRAKLHGLLGQPQKAYRDCERLRQLQPNGTSYCKACGELALGAKKYKEASTLLLRYLEAGKGDAEAQHLLAEAYHGQRDYTAALIAVNACVAAQPDTGAHYALRAQIYEQAGTLKLAASDYQIYLNKNPADNSAWLRYALLLQKLGRKADACNAFAQSQRYGNLDAGRYLHRFCPQ